MWWNGIHPIFLSNISFSIEPKCVMCSCLVFYVCMQTRYVLIWWKDLGTHISQTVFVPASKAPFLECVDGPDDESTGREFNKLIQFGIQSTIERTGDNGNFSSAHCLHTCSRFRQRSTHVLKANEKQAKRARKLCKHLIFIHIQYWHLPIWRGYLRNVVRLSVRMTTAAAKEYRISYVCVCKNAYYTTSALLKIVEWKKNIEWIFNRTLGTPTSTHTKAWTLNMCVCLCARYQTNKWEWVWIKYVDGS